METLDQDTAKALLKKHGTKAAAARAAGIPVSTFSDRLRGVALGGKAANNCAGHKTAAGKSLSAFRREYDKDTIIPEKVRAGLKELGASWEYESEFVRRIGVSFADLGNYRDEFAEFVVFVRRDNKRVWAGTKAFAAQLREMV